MSRWPGPETLGEPALKVGGFQLWIHGREFPEAETDDGDWLVATAHCGASGASVWVHGAIVMGTDFERFRRQCETMLRGETLRAELDPLEPNFGVSLQSADRVGHIRARVDITPDPLLQSHTMEFELDQSWLPGILRQCSAILREYPVRGA